MSESRWSDLNPEQAIVAALANAGPRPVGGDRDAKKSWSEVFANECAVVVAEAFRAHKTLKGKFVRPMSVAEGVEPLTPLGSGTSKRIDVTIADAVLGLEIGLSLKSSNFKDGRSNNYDKNLTGRLYELGDEVRLVHEHLPHAFMVAFWFVPLEGTEDKKTGNSSFANTVLKLKERTGRLDVALQGQASRCDASFVALYTNHDGFRGYPPGLLRLFDTANPPPRRGRPKVEATLSLTEGVDAIVRAATYAEQLQWDDPEEDT